MGDRPTLRERQAAATQREIVSAARALFARQGYAATTVAQIASAAGVSVQTIYDSIGSKGAIVARLNDLLDEEGDVAALAGRLASSSDPRELVEVTVTISRNINDRCEDIMAAIYSAASAEPKLRAVRDESRRRHREGCTRVAGKLSSLGALRRGLDVSAAADVLAGVTDPQVARTFVVEYGWSWDRWQDWTTDAAAQLLLRS